MGMELDEQRPLLTLPGEGEIVTDRPERTLRILGELDELIVTWFRYEPGEEGPDAHIHRAPHRRLLRARGRARALARARADDRRRPGRARSPPRRRASCTRSATRATRPSSSSTSTSRRRASATTSAGATRPSTSTTRRPTAAGRSPTPSSPGLDEAETLRHDVKPAPDPLRPAAADRDRHDLPAGVRGRRPAHPRRPRGRLLRARGPASSSASATSRASPGPGTFVAAPPGRARFATRG